jgi:acyl-CoA synthetase (AMP-forming)/AMP-acid ligase II
MSTLNWLLQRRAGSIPDYAPVTYLKDDGTEDPVTCRQIAQMARRTVDQLAGAGVPAGSRILMPMLPGREFIGAFWGAIEAGMLAVPAPPPLDAGHAAWLRNIAEDCAPAVALTTLDLAPALAGASTGTRVLVADGAGPAPVAPVRGLPVDSDAAYLQYGSGTTERLRGAVITHGQVLASCTMTAEALPVRSYGSGVAGLPEWFGLGLLSQVILPVFMPYHLDVLSPLSFMAEPLRLLDEMSRREAYGTAMPASAYELVARLARAREPGSLNLAGWGLAVSGSDTADPARLREFAAALAPHGFAGGLCDVYGCAEASMICATGPGLPVVTVDYQNLVASGWLTPAPDGVEILGCGRPAPGMDVRVVAPCGPILPDGGVGEVAIGGPGVARRYWDGQARTIEVPGTRLLLTGDLGAMLAGTLYLLGRTGDVIPGADGDRHPAFLVERAAARVPGIRPGLVAAIPSGSGRAVLVAEPGPSAGGAAQIAAQLTDSVRRACRLDLEDVILVPKGTIPVTGGRKVRRGEVRAMYRNGYVGAATQLPVS